MKRKILIIFVLCFSVFNAFSQINKDVDGCKDYPLFPRLPSYLISECSTVNCMLPFINDSAEYVAANGSLTTIIYSKDTLGGDTLSNVKIMKYYAKIILRMGGRVVYADNEHASFEFSYKNEPYKFMLTEFYKGLVFKMQVLKVSENVDDKKR